MRLLRNNEIVSRLEESFEQKFVNLNNLPTEDLMKELAKRLHGFSMVVIKDA